MTQYTTLIEIDSSLTIVVSGEEVPYQGTSKCFQYRADIKEWLRTSQHYQIANAENEKMFIDFVGGYKHKTNDFNLAVGIKIKPENFTLHIATDGPKKGTTIAYFVPPIPEVVEEETQADYTNWNDLVDLIITGQILRAKKQFVIKTIRQ